MIIFIPFSNNKIFYSGIILQNEITNFNCLIQLKSKIISFIINHKILILVSVVLISLVVFSVWAIKVRNNFIARMKSTKNFPSNKVDYSTTPGSPSLNIDNLISSDSSVLGTSDNNSSTNVEYNNTFPTPTPYPIITQAPLPTAIPEQYTTTTNTTNASTNNSSGNPNCTTGAGVPNPWFSDVYPNPPITTNTGSVTLIVYIRDCNKNTAPVTDTLSISLSSGDSSTQVNGNNLPYSVTTQNGQASFTVASQNVGTVTLIIQDTTSSFTVTNINDKNPSVTFGASASSNPTPTTVLTPVPASTDTPTPTITVTPTPTPTDALIPTPTPSIP